MPPLGVSFGLVHDYHYGRAWTQLNRIATWVGNATATYKPADGYYERVRAVSFQLVTDATVANRRPRIKFLDETGVAFCDLEPTPAQAASLTGQWSFAIGAGLLGAGGDVSISVPLPSFFLVPGYSVVLSVGSGVATDSINNTRLMVEKWQTGPDAFPPQQGPELTERELARDRLAHVDPYP